MTGVASEQQFVGWSFLRSKQWIGYYALIVIFSIVCVFLGNWQFDRRAEAQAEIARIDAHYDASPVPLHDALADHSSYSDDEHKWQPVSVTGTYIDEPYLVRNRPSAHGVGSVLLHPLRTEQGDVFFVDRGWVPVNASEVEQAALPQPAQGAVEVVARLRGTEQHVPGRENVGRTLGVISPDDLRGEYDADIFTGAYGQLVSESPSGESGELPSKPERDEGPHLSYALQWYAFILIVIGGAWYAARLEYRSLNAGSEKVRAQTERKEARKKRRGLSDAEEEDAYLDA